MAFQVLVMFWKNELWVASSSVSDKNDENNPNCVHVVGAFHAGAGAEPPCEVKLDVVDGNYEGGAVFRKLSKNYRDISSILYQ